MKNTATFRYIVIAVLVCSGACIFSGCAGVQAWDRGNLADYTIKSDRDPLSQTLAEHMYFSREAASGGRSVGGGGCGCN